MVLAAIWEATLPEHGQQPIQGEIYCSKTEAGEPKSTIAPPIWRCILKNIDDPETSQKPAEKSQTVSEIYSIAILGWLREWLHKLVIDPVSLFTLVLGVFTVGLYKETAGLRVAADQQKVDTREALDIARESADAATLSANAAIGVELPRFVVSSVSMRTQGDIRVALKAGRPVVHLTNHGRTSAEIICDSIELRVIDELPTDPPNTTVALARVGSIVEPGHRHQINRGVARALTDGEIESVVVGGVRLWLFGRVWYRDFLGEVHIKWFCCWGIMPPTTVFEGGAMVTAIEFASGGPQKWNAEQNRT